MTSSERTLYDKKENKKNLRDILFLGCVILMGVIYYPFPNEFRRDNVSEVQNLNTRNIETKLNFTDVPQKELEIRSTNPCPYSPLPTPEYNTCIKDVENKVLALYKDFRKST